MTGEAESGGDDRSLAAWYSWGQSWAEQALTPEDDPQKLLTEVRLHGLRAKLCDDVDVLDSYLPPQIAAMARKVADALAVPQLATV